MSAQRGCEWQHIVFRDDRGGRVLGEIFSLGGNDSDGFALKIKLLG